MQIALRFARALSVCSLLAAGFLIAGCDSSGSGGEESPLENTSSVTVDLKSSSSGSSTSSSAEEAGAKASGTLTVGFHYENDSGSDCNLSTTETITDSDLPYNESFDPSDFSESLSSGCGSPADFDGVKVGFAPGSGFSIRGLVLSLLDEDNTEIVFDNDASDGLSVSEKVSDNVDLPDDLTGGNDNDGDDSGDTTVPSAPSDISGSTVNGTMDLRWDAVSASDLSGYNIYRSTSPIKDVSGRNPVNGLPLTNTSYTDDLVDNGNTYYYVVTAVGVDGNESNASNGVAATPSGGGSTSIGNLNSLLVELESSSSVSSVNTPGEKAATKVSGTLAVGFHYENDSGSDCNLSTTETITDSDLPYSAAFDPTILSGSLSSGCGSRADFDGVKVEFAPGSGSSASGLTLKLFDEDGAEITFDADASDGLSVSGTVSGNVDLPSDSSN